MKEATAMQPKPLTPVKFEGMTHNLGAPPNWDEENNGPCCSLPVRKTVNNWASVWKFTWRQRLQILFGRNLCLTVHAFNMPPVALEITETKAQP